MVGGVAQQFAERVARALVAGGLQDMWWASSTTTRSQCTWRRPGRMSVALGEVERSDDLLLLQPLVDAELVADVAALEHDELLVELLLQLPLPLEGKVGRDRR